MSQNKLMTMDAGTLLTTPLPPTRFIASELIPQGLHILAGVPKIGKSWLALQICLRVTLGGTLWTFPITSGTVLYLCLEDSFTRIQTWLFDITDEASDNLLFATMSEVIGEGFENQIEDFLKSHPDTVLIVIDTLQRIRKASADANPYASDYRDIGILKQLADKHRIAILLIHHLRKMNDYDPQPSDEIIIHLSDVMESLLSFSGTATDLASEVEKVCGAVIRPNILIKKMIHNQAELAEHGITFEMKRTHDRKEINLHYERVDCVGNDGKTDTASVSNLSTQPS